MIDLSTNIEQNMKKSPLFLEALHIIKVLQSHQFIAYFAGGCVRDAYLGRPISDIDIATNATPSFVEKLFSNNKAIGAHFGVILVVVKKHSFEVATFREDGDYSDGRRPQQVTYSSPQEDAKRRDFTINGLFFDPITLMVHDFVGGIKDLDRRILTCIGNAKSRFTEDKLRILRFFRFFAQLSSFGFKKDPAILQVIKTMSQDLVAISRERVKEELIKIFDSSCVIEVLKDFNALELTFPIFNIRKISDPSILLLSTVITTNTIKKDILFPLALVALIYEPQEQELFLKHPVNRLFVLSNKEKRVIHTILALVNNFPSILSCSLHKQKRLLRLPYVKEGLIFLHSFVLIYDQAKISLSHQLLDLYQQYQHSLYPQAFVTGNTLIEKGLIPSKMFHKILTTIENAQLDETIHTEQECLELLNDLLNETMIP